MSLFLSVLLQWSTHLFHGKQPDNIAVVELPQHLKLSHLDVMGAVVAHHVKHLDGYQLTRLLHAHTHAHTYYRHITASWRKVKDSPHINIVTTAFSYPTSCWRRRVKKVGRNIWQQ